MKKIRCPHCKSDVHIEYKVVAVLDKGLTMDCFPKTWKHYAGEKFSVVYIKDREYIEECIADENITGLLREGLESFYNKINGGIIK